MNRLTLCLIMVVLVLRVSSQEKIVKAVEPAYDSVNAVHRLFFGQSYRALWAAPVSMRIIHINEEKGGLIPYEKGGGLQTKSLKLKDKQGKEWVLRSIQKYPEKGLPPNLKKTIAKDILQDQVVTGHPYAALTFPVFADALGIYHTNPEVVYLAADNSLGQYLAEFGNSVLLLEEKLPDGVDKAIKTDELQDIIEQNSTQRVNQTMLLRIRILNLLLGDWDRHEGQWKWFENKTTIPAVYEPLPFDHDKIFYNTTGIFPTLLSFQSLKENLQGFRNTIRNIDKYNFNNRYFDRYFLNELNWQDWEKEISFVQQNITDSVIGTALNKLPDTIYSLSAKRIISVIKARRVALQHFAKEYYEALALKVDISATNGKDIITITKTNDTHVVAEIKNERGVTYYNRTFNKIESQEIRLFSLGGNDSIVVKGKGKLPLKIRIVGGAGNDIYDVEEDITSRKKIYIYDNSLEKNSLPSLKYARQKINDDSLNNNFDRKAFKYNRNYKGSTFYFNRDQGLLAGIGLFYTKQGFKKEPFAENQKFVAGYSTARRSLNFSYEGYFVKVFNKSDLSIILNSVGPYNISNFFGLGNETTFSGINNETIHYYRNRFDIANGDIKIVRKYKNNLTFSIGPSFTWYGSSEKNNTVKYFKAFNTIHEEEKVFENKFYAGGSTSLFIDKRDSKRFTASGYIWSTTIKAMKRLSGSATNFGSVFSEYSVYLPITKDSNFIIANKIGAGTTIGQPTFFQQLQLGGSNSLRGYALNRFTGNTVLYHNIDVRCKLFDFTSYLLPGSVGLIAFHDAGRVWRKGEISKKWHNGYGGGIYIEPAELIVIEAIVAHSKEGYYPYISLGFTF